MSGTTAAHVLNKDKLEQLNKQAPRVVLDGQSSNYEDLIFKLHMVTLEQKDSTEHACFIQCINACTVSHRRITYLKVHEAGSYILRGYAKLKPPNVRTTTCVLHPFRQLASSVWNKQPDTIRKADTLSLFNNENQTI